MSDAPVPRLPGPTVATRIRRAVARIDWMMLFPVAVAVAWGLGHDAVAMVMAIVLPLCIALDGHRSRLRRGLHLGSATGGRVIERSALTGTLEEVLRACDPDDLSTALLLVRVRDLPVGQGDWGADMGGHVMQVLATRVAATVRDDDGVFRHAADGLAVVLAPARRMDLDLVMQIVDRLQAAIAEGVPLDGRTIHVRSTVGLCTGTAAPEPAGEALLAAAECALHIAERAGDDAVRVFDPAMKAQVETGSRLTAQIADALRDGDIRPWFQPQIDAATGAIAGLEALARWHHPELGVLTPDRFLPALASAGLSAELGDVMLNATLEALSAWDAEGVHIPCVGVNLSMEELSDPRLADRIAWQVDRHGLAPERISVEILETVTLRDGDETVVRNIHALRQAGFRLDLDDFGTGAASIAHIATFGVHRIKIDRSFVHGLVDDEDRQRVIAAILGLADQLDIATLAEGVETAAEQALLSKMGCGQLQGFGIARPMPLEDVRRWLRHRAQDRQDDLQGMLVRGTA